MDDGIRELHGCLMKARTQKQSEVWTIREREQTIAFFQDFSEKLVIVPRDARFLARKLYRLARRIEQRQETSHD